MAVIPSKPNTKLPWASQGNRAEPTSDKQLEGWVQEIPPHEMENWVQYKQDLAIKYLYQEGIPEWDSSFEFNTTSYVKYNGVIYKLKEAAEVPNVNKQPDIETTSWEIAFEPYGASSPLAEEIRKIKELEGYLTLYVSKANPVMTGIATAPEFQATAEGGHTFQDTGTDTGMFLNSNNEPEFRINNSPKAVVRNNPSLTASDNTIVTMDMLQELLRVLGDISAPTGSVVAMAARVVPEGYLECNGSTVSRATYSKLFSVLGTTFGAGDGASTFNLPDLRGEFIRGFDSGRGVDPSRQFGSHQGDAIRNITGEFAATDDNRTVDITKGAFYDTGISRGSGTGGVGIEPILGFDASRQVPTANENRPRNVSLTYIIKT